MSVRKSAGIVTAYGSAVQGGYNGTYEEFCALLAEIPNVINDLENMTVDVTTLAAGSSATASYADGVLTLGIPKGDQGDKGDKGDKGNKGDTGATPAFSIGTVTTGAAGTDAAATITGTAAAPVLNLTIPKGADGAVPAAAIAPTEATTTASRAYAIGERFFLGGTLYIATTPIASGGTIVVSGSGANCKTDVLGADLTAQSEAFEKQAYYTNYTNSKLFNLTAMEEPDFYHIGLYEEYPFPDSDFNNIGVKIFSDKRNFMTNYDHEAHKNSGGRLWYFAPDGNDNNSGLTPNLPKRKVSSITSSLSNGDTIILLPGVYTRAIFLDAVISKSVNIIGQGDVVLTNADANYTYASEGSNTYSTARSNVVSVLIKIAENIYRPLRAVSSVDSCKSIPFSYYSASTTVYINVDGIISPNNENVFLNLSLSRHLISMESTSSDVNIYMENITAIGGDQGLLLAKGSASYELTLHAYKCKFLGANTTSSIAHDAVSVLGAKAYFEKCEASYARKDGFNYHALNNKPSYGFELDCIGSNNGFNWDENNANGSTAHEGSCVIRINSFYHDNKGSNVCDVQANTKTLNIRCVAFNSVSESTASKCDFNAQQAGATMWIDCCKAFGSEWSLYPVTGTAIYAHNTNYETTNGAGTLDTEWNPYT